MLEAIQDKLDRHAIVSGGKPRTLEERVAVLELKFSKLLHRSKKDTSRGEFIIKETARFFVMHPDLLTARKKIRRQDIVEARWVAILLVKEFAGYCDNAIATLFNCDHASVSYALEEMKDRMELEPVFRQRVLLVRGIVAAKLEAAA